MSKRLYSLYPVLLLMLASVSPLHGKGSKGSDAPSVKNDAAQAAALSRQLGGAPLLFTENRGQVADNKGALRPDILFTAHSGGAKVYLTATGIHYQFEKTTLPEGYEPDARLVKDHQKQEALRQQIKTETYRFTLSLEGSNPSPKIRKEARNAFTESFYLAHCPDGITSVHTYGRVVMEDVYPGIDWVIYSSGQGLKYDFIVHPGADAALIKLKVTDAEGTDISRDGALIMKTRLGTVTETAPVSFAGGKPVATAFKKSDDGTIGFTLDSRDRKQTLTIDPRVSWATYYGGAGDETVGANTFGHCAIDLAGNVYLAGSTNSSAGIASVSGYQASFGGNTDAYLVKFSSGGAAQWATYYGGTASDVSWGCATDPTNNIYVAGTTSSTAGIASGGFQNTPGSTSSDDAFLVKFNSNGARIWGTYYGGSNVESGLACTTDASGAVYLAGLTASASGIASGGYQNSLTSGSLGPYNGFLVKFSGSGARLWGTYYGGGADETLSCATDASGNVYICGDTRSTSNIASGGFQNTFGGGYYDAYLAKFNSGGALQWATYYGGTSDDVGWACKADASGNVYMAGSTNSTSGIASGGFQNTFGGGGGYDAFLVKLNSSGARIWGTYYGGNGSDEGLSCSVDALGNAYLTGYTGSGNTLAYGGFQNNSGGGATDAFLAKFSSSGARIWGTLYGGSGQEKSSSCPTDPAGNIYMAGYTSSASGIASGGFQNTYGGGNSDNFLARISQLLTGTVNGPLCPGSGMSVPFTNTLAPDGSNVYTAQLSDGNGSFAAAISIGTMTSAATSGNIPVTIPASAAYGARYRIRVIGSSPADTGSDNGSNLVISGRLYVDSSAAAWGTGESWASPLKTVDSALRIANLSSCTQEIWVKQGTYYPMAGTAIAGSQDSSFRILRNGIKIYGGFGGNDTTMAARNPGTHFSILSGNIGAANTNTDNSYHVITVTPFYSAAIDTSTLLDGFTVRDGCINGSGTFSTGGVALNRKYGGGMYNASASPAVTNCTFSANSGTYGNYGSGMYNNLCSPAITGCTFSGNSGDYGGGICNNSSSPSIINCTFSADTVINRGGGIYNKSSSPIVTNCIFSGNGSGNYGGGINNENSSAPAITNCIFSDNYCVNGGGGISNFSASSPTVTNCTISANTSSFAGGGMYNNASSPAIRNCIIWGNTATYNSPAIYDINSSSPIAANNLVQGGYPGTGNISSNPLFVNAGNSTGADGIWGTADDGLRLQAGSPAINAGDNTAIPQGITTDVTGAARIQAGNVDMGAYEAPYSCAGNSIVYVDSSRTASGDGSSWATAYKTLSEGLDAANSCLAVNQVWVKQGTYYPMSSLTTVTTSRDSSFRILRNGIKIYGGFGGNDTTMAARNVAAHLTVLSGNISPAGTYNNCYHVVTIAPAYSAAIDTSTVLNGFTIRDGQGDGSGSFGTGAVSYDRFSGGGLYLYQASPAIALITCKVNGASYGGGMYNGSSSPSIRGTVFTLNHGTYGAGMYNAGASPVIDSTFFLADTASYTGGGMYNESSSPLITRSVFSANKASISYGGGVYNETSSPVITNTVFSGNSTSSFGGGMMNVAASYPAITNCVFVANTSGSTGSAIRNVSSAPVITGTTFSGNTSSASGTISNSSSSPVIANCIIWGNTAFGNTYIVNQNSSVPAVTYSVVQGGYTGAGNLSSDPLFINAGNSIGADGLWGTADDGLRLSPASPAINTGSNAAIPSGINTDITGVGRIQQSIVDMGAYESGAFACPAGPIVYVDSSKAISGNGSSWANAFKTVTEGLNAANNCTSVTQVWVKQGTYYPMAGAIVAASRDSSFRILRNGIKVYGGFGGNDTTMATRSVVAHPAILSGNIGQPNDSTDNAYHVITIIATAATTIDTSTLIDGFTITRATANVSTNFIVNGQAFNRQGGGGIYMYGAGTSNSCGPKLANNTISLCYASYGGGVYLNGTGNGSSSPVLDNCLLTHNKADIYGGGLVSYSDNMSNALRIRNSVFSYNTLGPLDVNHVGGGAAFYTRQNRVAMDNCTITGNAAESASGIKCDNGKSAITNCSFTGNTVTANNASLYYVSSNGETYTTAGGAAYHGWNDTCVYTNCIFSGNSGYFGGAIFSYNTNNYPAISLTLNSCTLSGDSATYGGAIYTYSYNNYPGISLTLANTKILNNNAAVTGGGIGSNGTLALAISNSTLSNNSCGGNGGGIYSYGAAVITGINSVISNNTCTAFGAAVRNYSGTVAFNQCVIANNASTNVTAGGSGGIHNTAGITTLNGCTLANNTSADAVNNGNSLYSDVASTLNITNTIVWGSSALAHIVNAGTANYSYSDLKGITPSGSNLSTDPLFANAGNATGADNIWGSADDGLKLTNCSPALNTGSNSLIPTGITTDITGAARIQQSIVDMGAYESGNLGALAITAVSSNPTTCGGSDGSIILSGLTAGNSYIVTYSLNGIPQSAITLIANSSGAVTITNLAAGSYSSILVKYGACTSNTAAPIVLAPPTPPVISAVTPASPTTCGGTNGSMALSGLNASTPYIFSYYNGVSTTSFSGTTTASGSYAIANLPAGTYSSITAQFAGCTGTYSSSITLAPPPTPATPAPSNNGPTCQGSSITLNAAAVSGATYSWTGPGAYTATGPSPVITNAQVANSGSYSVIVTVANCPSAPGSTVVTVNPVPAIATVSGSSPSTCAGSNGSITITGLNAAATYLIGYSKNGTAQAPLNITAGTTGLVVITGLGAGTYTAITAGLSGCTSAPAPGSVALSDPSLPAMPAVSSNSSVCAGDTLKLMAAALPGMTYSWAGPGFSSTLQNPVIINAQTSASGTYSLTVTSTSTMCSSAAAILTATVYPIPVISTASSTNPLTCNGTTGTITLNGLSANMAYTINYIKNGTPQTASLIAGASGSIIINGLSAGTYSTVTVKQNGCASSPSGPFTLSDPPIPPAPGASSNSPVCQNGTLTLSVGGQPGATFSWSGPNSFLSTSATLSLGNIQAINAGIYSVTQSVAGCVSAAGSTVVVMSTVPGTPGVISGNATPCFNSAQTYSVLPVATATSYSWTIPAGSGWSTSGSNTASIGITTGSTNGVISVAAVNACGSSSAAATLALAVNNVPAQPGAITGPAGICNNTSGTYSITPVSNTVSYAWTLPSGWSGTGLSSSTISATASAISGSISVIANNVCGNSLQQSIAVTVTSIPAQPGIIAGSDTPCINAIQMYTVGAVPGATSYTWSYPAGGLPAWSGSSATNSISLTAGTNSGAITVLASNQCGNGVPQSLPVTVRQLPVQPGIISGPTAPCAGSTVSYSVAASADALSYLWGTPASWTGAGATGTISLLVGSTAGTISVTPTGACGNGPTRTLSVSATPVAATSVMLARSTPSDTICSGTSVTFTASPVNGGSAPVYVFRKNGVTVAGTGNSYTDNALANGDIISVTMASSLPCVTATQVKDSIKMTVKPIVMPGININTIPPIVMCAGTAITFITNNNGAGASPAYDWYKNGALIGGVNTSSYTTASLANGDTVQVRMTTSEQCAVMPAVYSNKVGVTVINVVLPTVSVSVSPAGPVASGTSVTFTATQTGGGATPGYQWLHNSVVIPGATGAAYTTTTLQNGDRISVQMQSYAACAVPSLVISSSVMMQISTTSVANLSAWDGAISLYPNPNTGHFTIAASWAAAHMGRRAMIDVISALGQRLYHVELEPDRLTWSYEVWLNESLANGTYMLRITSEDGMKAILPFMLNR